VSDDLLDLLTGGKESLGAAPRDPVDAMVRTVYGEADNDPASRQAVAGVIRNRATRLGKTYDEIVRAPGQFEAWSRPDARARMEGLAPASPEYQAIKSQIEPVLNGQVTVPYDHFYSPGVLKGRGQATPAWDDGSGKMVGTQMFLTLGDHQPADLNAVLGAPASDTSADAAYDKAFGGASTEITNGGAVASDTKQPFTAKQNETYQILAKGMLIDPAKPPGDVQRPWMQRHPEDTFAPGQFYIGLDGKIRQSPGADNGGGYAKGFMESPNDLMASLARTLPFTADSTVGNAARGNALLYNAQYGADPKAMIGRLGGTLLFTTPAMLAGGEGLGALGTAVADAAPVTAPAVRFLGGSASGFKANPLLWAASKATQGAEQGALGGALTSGQSDRPVSDIVAEDAKLGAMIGPAIPAIGGMIGGVRNGLRGVAEPFTEAGRNKLVDRFLIDQAKGGPTSADLSEIVPGSRPTLAQATGNPGIARVERQAQLLNPTPFSALAKGNQQARELAVDAARGDKQSLDDLIATRSNQTDPLREGAFANTTPVDPSPAIKAIDDVLASPSGQRDAVKTALTSIRDKLEGQTDPAQLWGIRQAIGDMLSPLSAGTKGDGRLASRELMGVQDALDPVIEGGAPGFQGYLAEYSKASKEIGAQQFLQGLNFTTSDGTITLGKVSNALNRIEAMRAKGGANPAKDISAQTLKNLYSLRDDLVRQARDQIGRGTGSDTVQKLATNKLVETLGIPTALGVGLHNPLAGAAVGLTKMALASKNQQLLNLLTGKLVDPAMAPSLTPAAPTLGNRLIPYLAGRAGSNASVLGATQLVNGPS